jgi:hypothetical protein
MRINLPRTRRRTRRKPNACRPTPNRRKPSVGDDAPETLLVPQTIVMRGRHGDRAAGSSVLWVSRRPRLRFGFRLVDGPNAGLSCGGWRVWTHSEDTYITAKPLRDTWKVSLHADEWWATAVTRENTQREDSILPSGLPRSAWRFQPTEFVDGSRIAFGIGVLRHALRGESIDHTETVISVPDRWDLLSLALVRMTEPGVDAHPDWTL